MIWNDLRYGLRTLRKTPGFTAVAILTLALGIGANTAIFTVVNAVLLKPLAYRDPSRLVMAFESHPSARFGNVSPMNFLDWREQNQAFAQIAASSPQGYVLTSAGGRSADAERLQGSAVSASLFPMLGVEPILGRNFLAEEDRPEANRAVIISYALWQRSFGGDRSLLGKTLVLDNESYTLVGILPPGFQFSVAAAVSNLAVNEIDVWTPLERQVSARSMHWRGSHYLRVFARLKPGVTAQRAQQEMTMIARRIKEAHPEDLTAAEVTVMPLQEFIVGGMRQALLVLLGAVCFVLLIACVNVANLQLARATARAKEIAIRAAMGAGRHRLIQQLLTESVVLATAGGALGILLAQWGTESLIALSPDTIPRAAEIHLDGWVLAFTLVVSVGTGILFGIAPAFMASSTDANETLKEGGRSSAASGGGRHRLRSGLVIAEVALSLVLMIGAGLLVTSFSRLTGVDPGIRPENVLTVRLALADPPYDKPEVFKAFYRRVVDRLKSLPGVESAAAVSSLPMTPTDFDNTFTIVGRPPLPPGEFINAQMTWVSPDYFRAVGIPLIRGRYISEQDKEDSPQVVVISEAMARRWWPNEDSIGKRLAIGYNNFSPEIVGIVGDIHNGLDSAPEPYMYVAYPQLPRDAMYLVAKASGTLNPAALAGLMRREIQGLDKNIAVYRIRSMEQVMAVSVGSRRFNMLLLGIFAGLAMVLAAVGIYGVMAYGITQRTHEIGIRMALGARRSDVLGMLVRHAMILAGAGVAIGVAGALILTRWMANLLFGVTPTDPVTFALVSLSLAAVVFIASYIPAQRATRVDPMEALRYE